MFTTHRASDLRDGTVSAFSLILRMERNLNCRQLWCKQSQTCEKSRGKKMVALAPKNPFENHAGQSYDLSWPIMTRANACSPITKISCQHNLQLACKYNETPLLIDLLQLSDCCTTVTLQRLKKILEPCHGCHFLLIPLLFTCKIPSFLFCVYHFSPRKVTV